MTSSSLVAIQMPTRSQFLLLLLLSANEDGRNPTFVTLFRPTLRQCRRDTVLVMLQVSLASLLVQHYSHALSLHVSDSNTFRIWGFHSSCYQVYYILQYFYLFLLKEYEEIFTQLIQCHWIYHNHPKDLFAKYFTLIIYSQPHVSELPFWAV